MLTLAAPWALVAGALAAAVVVGLHLLAWRRPSPTLLPTARFAPPSAVRAVARDLRLSDLLLLLVRVAVLLLAGLALARPAWTSTPTGTARVLVLDASRRVARVGDVADSAHARATGADQAVWIRVDSVARVLPDTALGARAEVRGALGAGLVAGVREAVRLARTHDTVELVVISPFAAESWDASVEAVRGQWGGDVRAVRVAAIAPSPAATRAEAANATLRLPPTSDPVGAALALALDSTASALRVVRSLPTADDSSWARGGGVVVWWPDLPRSDTVTAPQAITVGGRTVIGRFGRLPRQATNGRPIARWGDGSPAADETAIGRGCIRSVGVGVPSAGDEVLRPSFLAVIRELAVPCGGGSAGVLDSARVGAWVRGQSHESAPGSPAVAKPDDSIALRRQAEGAARRDPLTDTDEDPRHDAERWLLLIVAALLGVEWWLRRASTAASDRRTNAGVAAREAA